MLRLEESRGPERDCTHHRACTLCRAALRGGTRGPRKVKGDKAVTSGATEMRFSMAPEDPRRKEPDSGSNWSLCPARVGFNLIPWDRVERGPSKQGSLAATLGKGLGPSPPPSRKDDLLEGAEGWVRLWWLLAPPES